MSSSSPSSTSSVSSSTETASASQGPSTTSQGNLYLFTFLSTLLVLLIISCSIVFRSFVLRRRYQRRLAEALAVGAVLAPRVQGSRKKRFRTRPKFYDTWISDAEKTSIWADLMPVSVLPVKTKRKVKETEPIKTQYETRTETLLQRLFASHFLLRNSRPGSGSRTPTSDSDSSNPPSPGSSGLVVPQEKPYPLSTPSPQKNLVQVTVLVEMPSPRRLSAIPSQEEQIPEVVFGVTRLHCRDTQPDI
ncbi:hypothetical protein F5879DRAFT_996948 [Lentinula edodes]|uniref:uncharacterized protein n=1 Tax=Lentinula edodes TaxID=5353 RepID=UPI001E8E0B29|nr:uncharacterized protein C8R40DRAFT_394950 [Lentinula edodes]KAH7873152.1 hypothetical protein C8R40DRAFT_394950 [Lentinula edodes]KAJ3910609.1 hypothetical protein F5879DRAFT_996948 [Lentinula edodes]